MVKIRIFFEQKKKEEATEGIGEAECVHTQAGKQVGAPNKMVKDPSPSLHRASGKCICRRALVLHTRIHSSSILQHALAHNLAAH